MITELTLRVHGIPEHAVAVRIAFASLEDACAPAVGDAGAGLAVMRLELLDAETMRAVNAFKGTALDEAPSLFVELAGARRGRRGRPRGPGRAARTSHTAFECRARPDRARAALGGAP